jgi:LmbE family N-acetylglucosaminyl deacetylase
LQAALSPGRGRPPTLRGYEIWVPLGAFDHVEDITDLMPRKLRALRAHASQLKEFDYARAIRGLNQYRGQLAARRPYVEVFQVLERS